MADSQTQDIYGDFSPAGYAAWEQRALKEVKGEEAFAQLFKTSPEGITTRPFYTLMILREKNLAGQPNRPQAGKL